MITNTQDTEHIRKIKKQIEDKYKILFISFPVVNLMMPKRVKDIVEKRQEKVKEQAFSFASNIYDNEGFIHPKVYGEEVASMFWLFIQVLPADFYPDFQKKYMYELQKCLKLFPKFRPMYAMLYDKLALGEGKWQRYGTQPTSNELDNIQDIEGLKSRKDAMNLPK